MQVTRIRSLPALRRLCPPQRLLLPSTAQRHRKQRRLRLLPVHRQARVLFLQKHLQSSSAVTYETDDASDTACVTICEAGTYVLSGGRLTITHCQGDGIQGEWVSISGDDTYVDITTEYENAGVNYYSSSLGSGNYNTLTSNNSTKTETVNVDTGSHKGIKAGTKSSTCSYTSVTDDSTLV